MKFMTQSMPLIQYTSTIVLTQKIKGINQPKRKLYLPHKTVRSLMAGDFAGFLLAADLFQNQLFRKKSFRNTIRVSNSLDPDQVRCFVEPDLGPNCLQKLSADNTSRLYSVELNA